MRSFAPRPAPRNQPCRAGSPTSNCFRSSSPRSSSMRKFNRRQVLAGAAALPFVGVRARAANYPDKPIRVIIPYTAGGVPESITRLLAVSMEQRLGQKLIIEAKPGAGGNIGTQEVARAAPDGYTLLVAATNNFVINQFVMKMTFDPM